ncbi:MAG: serine/threonine-protein kinase [Planctomycetota bacterium]
MPVLDTLSEDDEIALQGALLLPSSKLQSDYLSSVCAGDPERLARLEKLLQHQDSAAELFSHLDRVEPSGPAKASSADKQLVGKFQLLQPLGSGGMSTVFLAEDLDLRRLVALKIPRAELLADARHRQRFVREAKLAAKLQHPGLVSVLEAGTAGAATYIVSEFCERGDLSNWLIQHDKKVAFRDAAVFVAELCEAVQYMHFNGVLHLDLKPSNILLRDRITGVGNGSTTDHASGARELPALAPMVTDFGVSRLIDGAGTNTNTSLVLGTLLFMAPEQLVPSLGAVGPKSDLYAIGIIFAQMIGASVAREGATYRQILEMLDEYSSRHRAVECDDLPSDLRTVLLRSTAKHPGHRYASVTDFANDLRAIAMGQPVAGHQLGVLRYLSDWSGRPPRIREAWWLCIGANSISAFWMIAGMILITGEMFPGTERLPALVSCGMLVTTVNFPMLVFGLVGLRGHSWPFLPALFIVLICNLLVPAIVLMSDMEVIPGLYVEAPFFERLNHFLVMGFGIVQGIALSVGYYASRRCQRIPEALAIAEGLQGEDS